MKNMSLLGGLGTPRVRVLPGSSCHTRRQEAVSLVPKLHLGTLFSAQFYCTRRSLKRNTRESAMELPQQVRSQIEFGNEGETF